MRVPDLDHIHWGRLFGTRFTTGCLILLGFVAFLIPGIFLLAKFAVLDMVVVLEGLTGSAARSRSSELTRGKRGQILAAWFLFVILIFSISFASSWLLEQLGPINNMWTSSAFDCVLDILGCLTNIVMFLFYWESVHCGGGKSIMDSSASGSAVKTPLID